MSLRAAALALGVAGGAALGARCAPASGPVTTASGTATGEEIARLVASDYVEPRFSPSGDRLAVSEVLREGDFENTQVLVLDVLTGRLDTLIAADEARKYGYYAAYVSDFEWLDERRLVATILDGDVNGTRLTIDVESDSILEEVFLDDEIDLQLTVEEQRVADRLQELYPAIRPPRERMGSVLESAVRNRAVIVNDTAVILQKNYAGFDHDIWYHSLRDSVAFPILALPERAIAALGGGVVVGDAVAFAVRQDSAAHIFIYDGGQSASLAVRAPLNRQTPVVMPRGSTESGAWFFLQAHHPYAEGHNPAYWFDGARLDAFTDFPLIHDFDVQPAAGRVAFAYWQDGRRQISVKRLAAPGR